MAPSWCTDTFLLPAAAEPLPPLPWFLRSGRGRLGTLLLTRFAEESLHRQAERANVLRARMLVENNPKVSRAFLADPEGNLGRDEPPDPAVLGRNFEHRGWYRGLREGGQTYVSEIDQRAAAGQAEEVAVAASVRRPRQEIVGCLVVQMTLETLESWCAQLPFFENGEIVLIAQHGRKVQVSGEQGTGGKALIQSASVPGIGWTVIVRQPWEMVMRPARLLRNMVIASSTLLFATLLGVAVVGLTQIQRCSRATVTAAQALRSAYDRLEAANGELETFSYSVSHNLRALLRHLDGYVKLLEKNAASRLVENNRRYLKIIARWAQQMGQLIDDLPTFSRASCAELRAMEVWGEWRIAPLPTARGDANPLRQVWVHLLGNAVRYMRSRATAVIEVGAEEKPEETVYFVRDNGAGFDPQYAQKLYGVFQRLHNAGEFEGAGIGLALTRRIVARHSGRAWAERKVGESATLCFSLPRQEGTS